MLKQIWAAITGRRDEEFARLVRANQDLTAELRVVKLNLWPLARIWEAYTKEYPEPSDGMCYYPNWDEASIDELMFNFRMPTLTDCLHAKRSFDGPRA